MGKSSVNQWCEPPLIDWKQPCLVDFPTTAMASRDFFPRPRLIEQVITFWGSNPLVDRPWQALGWYSSGTCLFLHEFIHSKLNIIGISFSPINSHQENRYFHDLPGKLLANTARRLVEFGWWTMAESSMAGKSQREIYSWENHLQKGKKRLPCLMTPENKASAAWWSNFDGSISSNSLGNGPVFHLRSLSVWGIYMHVYIISYYIIIYYIILYFLLYYINLNYVILFWFEVILYL